jgi:phosphoadenosine phosphosulfate reductase
MFTAQELAKLSEEFETKTPQEIIQWAADAFWPEIAMSSSFQTQSMPLLHMLMQIKRKIPVFFIDTGYHFWETLIFREYVASEWMINVIDLYRDPRWDAFVRQNTRNLPVEDPDLCCYVHKVQPMQKALQDVKAWISGIRRDQTNMRAKAKILELQPDGLLKINPLLSWSTAEIKKYAEENNLPNHPLYEKGYRSVGCAPCTIAICLTDDERAGRWAGRGKVECGLHTDMFQHKNISEVQSEFRMEIKENQKTDV